MAISNERKQTFMTKLLEFSDVDANDSMAHIVKNFDETYEEITKEVLSERQKKILDWRIKDSRTFREIAIDENVSTERIRQIEARCYRILRNSKYIDAFLHNR